MVCLLVYLRKSKLDAFILVIFTVWHVYGLRLVLCSLSRREPDRGKRYNLAFDLLGIWKNFLRYQAELVSGFNLHCHRSLLVVGCLQRVEVRVMDCVRLVFFDLSVMRLACLVDNLFVFRCFSSTKRLQLGLCNFAPVRILPRHSPLLGLGGTWCYKGLDTEWLSHRNV